MSLVKSCETEIHKVISEPKQPTQVPKRNNRNSFTARVGRKKKINNKNKLNFEDDEEGNEGNLRDQNNVRNENGFIEFNRSNRPIDNDNRSEMSRLNANSNIANIDQITDLHQSIHNTRRSRQDSINLIGLDDNGLLEN